MNALLPLDGSALTGPDERPSLCEMTIPSDALIARQTVMLFLSILFPQEVHETWLRIPRIDLSGRTPEEAMQAGRYEEVLTIFRQLKERASVR